ncbi:hypothetical protein [Microvirga tunisiensis]|uniref:Uncharacterized protein n=1 Tax=Microvirga tunisiensis TaxID=2108360 RepID=A0A5N7MQI3_9HYPH|nr:hypothetical protein [Microvirga tunisiensis]MPR11204.1 hypothetical protein [Microvirga tunisiensis]MPR29277.1 hypothetical protein [Microvirga tunisiensis]
MTMSAEIRQFRDERFLKMGRAELKHLNKGAAQHGPSGAAMQNQQHVSSTLNRLIIGTNRSFDLHGLWQSTSRTLSNLDFEHQHEIQRVERSRTDLMLKMQIVENLQRRHRERRQPYVMLIAELQKHLSSAVSDDLQAAG